MGFIRIDTREQIKWSDDSLFQGAVVLTLHPPTGRDTIYPHSSSVRRALPRPLPKYVTLPVTGGYIAENRILLGASISPPNIRFTTQWFDLTGSKIADKSALFDIPEGDTYNLTVPVLTVPVAVT